jgi:preprotein translocase subunit YajC
MVNNIKRGDRIITSGGIHGRVTAVSDVTMTVEIADKVRIKLARGNVTALVKSAPPAQVSKDSKTKSE